MTAEAAAVGEAVAWHESWHVPEEHTWPARQVWPQEPQFWLSLTSETQVPEQLVSPDWQVRPQMPPEQTSPAGQGWLHPPQLFR